MEAFGNVRTGLYHQPIGLDVPTSVRELTFLERGLPIAFLPFRQMGVMAFDQAFDGLATWAVSSFRFPTDVFGGALGDDGGYGAFQGSYAPSAYLRTGEVRPYNHIHAMLDPPVFNDNTADMVAMRAQVDF